MKVTRFQQGCDERSLQTPFVRFSTNGCGLDGCKCSPKCFLSFGMGPGKEGISVELTDSEASQITMGLANGRLEFQVIEENNHDR